MIKKNKNNKGRIAAINDRDVEILCNSLNPMVYR